MLEPSYAIIRLETVMGFYIRQSVRVGLMRINLSKSGVGVSFGVKGLRIGTGPRGAYIHAGRGGLYYRQRLGGTPRTTRNSPQPNAPAPYDPTKFEQVSNIPENFLVDPDSDQLLHDMNRKHQTPRLLPTAWILSLVLLVLPCWFWCSGSSGWWTFLPLLFSLLLPVGAYLIDENRKSVVLFYDMEPAIVSVYQQVHNAFATLRSCSRIWYVMARADARDPKYHGGATQLTVRYPVFLQKGDLPYIKSNVEIPSLTLQNYARIAFLPDKVLVITNKSVVMVKYSDLQMQVRLVQYVEDSAPPDATVVGTTWRYVNRSGGPDRRFANNPQLPICQYEQLEISTVGGLSLCLVFSRQGAANALIQAAQLMAQEN